MSLHRFFLAAALFFAGPVLGGAQETAKTEEDEALQFFAEEARVVSGSLRAQPAARSPSTVYVLTADQIRSSGARTLYSLLRMLPGVDVSTIRTFQGEVSIRGLNKPSNNRTLILIDGRTVLNGFLDYVTWEALPIAVDDIERIEVVEGAASALHGANALSGVINIITKDPEKVSGGKMSYAYGERNTSVASYQLGSRSGRTVSKYNLGYRAGGSFEDSSRKSSEAGMANAMTRWKLTPESDFTLSGGLTRHDAERNGPPNFSKDKGVTGFARADYRRKRLKMRGFWNAGRSTLSPLPLLGDPSLDYDTYDFEVEQAFSPHEDHELVVGGSWRRNTARSGIFTRRVRQDLGALFAEEEWRITERLTAVTGARLDRHPASGWIFSPRESLLFLLTADQTLRFSAATAFRNPTLAENYLDLTVPVGALQINLLGNTDLRPESMHSFEVGHQARFGRVRTGLTGFQYTLRDIVSGTPITPTGPGTAQVLIANAGATRALGGEASVEAAVAAPVSLFANYSYQSLKDEDKNQTTAVSAPKHKANAGMRLHHEGWSGTAWAHWVDKTLWTQGTGVLGRVPDYYMLNLYLGYAFGPGAWEGLELSLSAYNVTDKRHYEAAPFLSAALPGQGAELVRRQIMGGLTYKF